MTNTLLPIEELKKKQINTIDEIFEFLSKDNFFLIVSDDHSFNDIYNYTDNVFSEIQKIYNNFKEAKLLVMGIDDLKTIFNDFFDSSDFITKDNLPFIVNVENKVVKNLTPLSKFQNYNSLNLLSEMVIEDSQDLVKMFEDDKTYLLLVSDDLEHLSELLPEPRKNIDMLYKHYFKVDTNHLDLKVLYSDKKEIFNLFKLDELDASGDDLPFPLPIVFKIDNNGTLHFPIHINDIREFKNNTNVKIDNMEDLDSLMDKYNAVLDEMGIEIE